MKKRALVIVFGVVVVAAGAGVVFADEDEKPKKVYDTANPEKYKPNEENLRAMMKQMAAEIGVKCNYCHDVDDFSKEMPKKKIAHDMMKMTRMLRKKGAKNLSCKTCHMGNPTWLARE